MKKTDFGDLETIDTGQEEVVPQEPIPGTITPVPTPSYSELKMNCEKAVREGKIKRKIVTASFPDPKTTCEWGRNGNYGYSNGLIRARREQIQNLDINMGAKVCSLSMRNALQNSFYYDDNIFLTLNGYVLASTSNFTQHLEEKNGFYKYDWLRLRDQGAQNRAEDTELTDQYCAGRTDGTSSCSFPVTEAYGAVKLEFNDEVFQKIFAMTSVNQVSLGLITTGDDNPNTDCQHVDLEFSVVVLYYE